MITTDIKLLARMLGSGVSTCGSSIHMSCPNATLSGAHKGIDSRHSFGIKSSDTTSVCHCFACHFGGTVMYAFGRLHANGGISQEVFDFIVAAERCDLVGFAQKLLMRKHMHVPEDKVRKQFNVHAFIHQCAARREADGFFFYRGLTKFEIERYKLGYDPKQSRATFPIYSLEGEPVGCVGRALHKGQEPRYWRYPTVDDSVLFGEQDVDVSQQKVVLVEGPLDAIKARRTLPNVLALNGLTLTTPQRQRLLHLADEVYLMFDGDVAGREGMENIGAALWRKIRVHVVPMPEGKDPDLVPAEELFRRFSEAQLYYC